MSVEESMNLAAHHQNANAVAHLQKPYQCMICDQGFKRAEHLSRHVRAHLQERPFDCRYCLKSFARKDLLTRHEKTIHATVYTDPRSRSQHGSDKPRRPSTIRPNLPQNHTAERDIEPIEQNESNDRSNRTHSDNHTSSRCSGIEESAGPAQISPRESQHNGGISSTFDNAGQILVSEQPDSADYSMDLSQGPESRSNIYTMIDDRLFSDIDFSSGSQILMQSPSQQPFGPNIETDMGIDVNMLNGTLGISQLTHERALPENSTAVSMAAYIEDGNRTSKLIDDNHKNFIVQDLAKNYNVEDDVLRSIGPAHMLDSFLSKFFTAFHHHLPIIHTPTFKAAETPSPLLLAMCSIGALYNLNTKHAAALRSIVKVVLAVHDTDDSTAHETATEPLWHTQCKLFMLWSSVIGGNTNAACEGLSDVGALVRPYALLRRTLSRPLTGHQKDSWEEWVHREMIKRTICGIFVFSSLKSSVLDIPPDFSSMRDLDFEMPVNESLWEAGSRDEWLWRVASADSQEHATIASMLKMILFDNVSPLTTMRCAGICSFAATMIMHGVNVHMYFVAQTFPMLMELDTPTNEQNLMLDSKEREIESTITRCQSFLKAWQVAHHEPHQIIQERSFIFNCQSILRLCYAKIFGGVRRFYHLTLMYEDKSAIDEAIASYVAAPLHCNAFSARAVEQIMYCFITPVKAGHMLTRKTAAFTWSFEHAVACWECNLILGKWIHTTELGARTKPLTSQERAIFHTLKEALSEADNPYDDRRSLAAQVTRQWAMFMDDVWVWEITVRMGLILRQLADMYDHCRQYTG